MAGIQTRRSLFCRMPAASAGSHPPTMTPLRSRAARLTAFVLALLVSLGARPAAATESLNYQWNLRGFLGRLAGVVLPNRGHGELRTHPNDSGRVTELEITSPASKSGEYFLYGGEMRSDGTTARAWSSYRWNGKQSDKRDKVEEDGVVDMASGIHLIREKLPQSSMRLRIWSDGKIYPVVVERIGAEKVVVPAGTFAATHFRVRGQKVAGERYWKGGLDLWLAQDEGATPVQIQVDRGFAHVRLELVPDTTAEKSPAGKTPGHR